MIVSRSASARVAAAPDAILAAVANQVAKGQCILFLGAGVHSPPGDNVDLRYSYSPRHVPPRGGDLSELLARACDYAAACPGEDVRRLARVASFYESQLGRQRLVADIRSAVSEGREPSPALRALAALGFPLVITTNYDRLFERALALAGTPYDHCIYSPDEGAKTADVAGMPSTMRPFILKIHGDVEHPASIVITEDDYIQFVLRMGDKEQVNPVPLGVRFLLKTWPTLFIGYSLTDYNLRLLFKTLRWRMDRSTFPMSWSVDPYPDRVVVHFLGLGQDRQIIFIAQDVWTFVPALYRLVKSDEMPT